MTPSEEKQHEFLMKLAEGRLMTALSHFSERVSEGSATPDEIAFMSKVAELLDQGRLREMKSVAQKAAATQSELIALL